MGINSTEVSFGFGQMGSAFMDTTAAYTPPTGKVIVAITIVKVDTAFTTLTPDTSAYLDGTTGAALKGASAYIGTTTPVGQHGSGALALDASNLLPNGVTIYGRWTAMTLAAGAVIMYMADAV
tara:strand:- start:203 stop:571 length:369 start_codon:yes stop_codon:yes gene_type:complete